MLKFADPFKHFVVDSFLNDEDFEKARKFHGEEEFFLKYTDLFKFLQTDEIAKKENVQFFIKNLERIFKDITDTTGCFYTVFGSYYREGDYLLTHDDKIDNRKYAFTYYLEDFDSGELVLFNEHCNKVEKKVSVKKNRLVIFEVSSISWHEVSFCESNGRRAITGWLNHKSIDHNIIQNKQIKTYELPTNIEFVDFELGFDESPVIQFPDIEYDFDCSDMKETGPFYMRRVNELILDCYVALNINNYELIYIQAYDFTDLNYILLNDFTNSLKGN